ncbi:uncharacterized protein ALTATR162_LOCUS3853 [Alternaria atra]|uniref:Uncharacterized protein n=1 Tax=Alternaria atra TaxID=119953 RepID=A0A8J2MYJ7_9PLEO|nr:uncharacterized protein ALTATR162_LOCUS3853 [Alternaria atra]CAG5155824.1 unnamed protein product [Alternaria atra]
MKQRALEWAGPYGAWCSVCSPEPEETHMNLPFCFITLPSEPAMNAAGRTSDHPFKDLRSARRTHQRSKRYPERIYSGNKRRRSDKFRPARIAALKDTYKGIESREWEGDWYAEWAHKVDMEHMDDIAAYTLFGKNAAFFEGRDEGETTKGEDFGSWARRRIAEMRRVKEYRMHSYGIPTSPTPLYILPHTMRNDSRPGRTSATILTAPLAKPHETTLPATLSDIRAHLALARALTPSANLKQRCRSRNIPVLPVIQGYSWWGEYTWQWHRNMSGCWFLGYEYGCREECVGQCTCLCWGSMVDKCYCEEFGVGTEWEVPAPEDVQRCSLVEWVRGELMEILEEDEIISKRETRRVEEERSLDEFDRDWEAGFDHEWEWRQCLDDDYVILEKNEGDSEAWSAVSGADESPLADFDMALQSPVEAEPER